MPTPADAKNEVLSPGITCKLLKLRNLHPYLVTIYIQYLYSIYRDRYPIYRDNDPKLSDNVPNYHDRKYLMHSDVNWEINQ